MVFPHVSTPPSCTYSVVLQHALLYLRFGIISGDCRKAFCAGFFHASLSPTVACFCLKLVASLSKAEDAERRSGADSHVHLRDIGDLSCYLLRPAMSLTTTVTSLARPDRRAHEESRPIRIVYEGLDRVDGSARFSFGAPNL